MQATARQADALRGELARAVDADSAAFEAVLAAYRLDRDDPARTEAIQAATLHAAEVPLETMRLSVEALRHLKTVAEQGNANAAVDAAAGAHMAQAAIEAAGLNVQVNLLSLKDQPRANELREQMASLQAQGRALVAEVLALARERAGLS